MTNGFMISVAALALVAGSGLANAQGTMGRDGGAGSAGAQPTQHSAQPSGGAAEHSGTMNRSEKGTVGQAGGSSGAMKSGQSTEDRSSGAMNKDEAADEKAGATKGTHANERAQGQQEKSKSMSSENQSKSGARTEGRDNMKAEGKGTDTNMNAEGRIGSSSTTIGQAGAGAKLSTEQRTQITTVIRDEHVSPVTHVNFSVSVGTRVPREGIELHALPSRVATIYPEWRSYRYILVGEQIVIVDPDTYEIVAVLNA